MTRPARRLTPLLAIVAAVVGVVAVAGGWVAAADVSGGRDLALEGSGGRDLAVDAAASARRDEPRHHDVRDGFVRSAAGGQQPGRAVAGGDDGPVVLRVGVDPRQVAAPPAAILVGLVAIRGRVHLAGVASVWRALVDHALRRGPPAVVVA